MILMRATSFTRPPPLPMARAMDQCPHQNHLVQVPYKKNKYIGTLLVNYGTLASPCPATVKLRFLAGWEAGAFFSRPVRRGIPAILPAYISSTSQ